MRYRVGRKQGRAILYVKTGRLYLEFPNGSEKAAKEYCDYLNSIETEGFSDSKPIKNIKYCIGLILLLSAITILIFTLYNVIFHNIPPSLFDIIFIIGLFILLKK